jgi:hypothetical protein
MFVIVSLILIAPAHAADIPESRLKRLQSKLQEAHALDSTLEQRRAYKNVIRDAEDLVERYRRSPERFKLVAMMFDSQKMLYTIQETEANQEALLGTAETLLEAPDEYASLRVEADMLMLQIKLAASKATPEQSALAIAEFADRYRGTTAEATSLMLAATTTFDLGNDILLEALRKTLAKRFAHEPDVSAFMRERFAAKSDVNLRGIFKRAGGGEMSFPIGRPYIVCFWSQDTPLLDEKIADIKQLQERMKGELPVYSFNLDETSDGGKRALQRLKLDWVPLVLPDGTENAVYRSSGGSNLFATIVIDAYGQGAINVAGGRGHGRTPSVPVSKRYEAATRYPRQSALLRSLCIGDYLIPSNTPPASAKQVLPPGRYRMTVADEMAQYQAIEKACGEYIAENAEADKLWQVHNRQTIAMMTHWRLTGDTGHLARAVKLATATLDLKPPKEGLVVPVLCVTKHALQDPDVKAGVVIDSFIEATGGDEAPGIAHAAALMLSLETHSVDQYLKHREALLVKHANDRQTWPVSSLLLDDATAARLFAGALPGKGENLADAVMDKRPFTANWTAIDGSKVTLPANDEVVRILLFIEETADSKASDMQKRIVAPLVKTVADRAIKNVELIGVFRGEAEKATALLKQSKWAFKAVALTDSDWSKATRQYGLFAPDQTPNAIVVHPDGGMMLALTGASPETARHDQYVYRIENAVRDAWLLHSRSRDTSATDMSRTHAQPFCIAENWFGLMSK